MALSINMNRQQSFILNDIKTVVRAGGNVTHLLNVKVSNAPDKGNDIRQRIFSIIRGRPITKNVYGINVSITWRSTANVSSAYYHSDNAMYTDRVVKRHTELLLRDILRMFTETPDNQFDNGVTGLAFIVTKPLTREIVLVDDGNDVY